MKILTGEQIAQADRFTIENEPVESINLMERAAEVVSQWICNNISQEAPLSFFIGKGNNGGDGLAVARMLYNVGYNCRIYMVFDKKYLSEDCRYNFDRLPRGLKPQSVDRISISNDTVIIDALLGVGMRGEIGEPLKSVIDLINSLDCKVVSIDMPSGLASEPEGVQTSVVKASTTLTFEYPKLSLLLPEAGENAGEIVILPIGLDQAYIDNAPTPYSYIDEEYASSLIMPRSKFAHKGSGGHALLICGSEGMAGAAVLAAGGALRSGCGLVTVHLPREDRGIIHTTNSSALVSCEKADAFSQLPGDIEKYTAIGVGCGIGMLPQTRKALGQLLDAVNSPMVIDADAINIIAAHPEMKKQIPAGSILTPHIGELRRLAGEWKSDSERNEKVVRLAAELSCYVVVKGAHTMICNPEGHMLFNSTGNSGMAKGGSGDVLTGYITGLLARGYAPENAAVLGVFVHGKAGDKAAGYFGQEGMNSADIIDFLGEALSEIS